MGYIISVIGGIVDKKNQKNEEYDNYQETITKLRDHYSLSPELCQKMKCDIKDKYNKQKATPLKKNIGILVFVIRRPFSKERFHPLNKHSYNKEEHFLLDLFYCSFPR